MAYQVWAFTAAGVKTAYLEHAYNVRREVKANQTPTLSFSLPADDPKAGYINLFFTVQY